MNVRYWPKADIRKSGAGIQKSDPTLAVMLKSQSMSSAHFGNTKLVSVGV
jgi:hypothetical protein